jgi:hypothetical protein
MNLETTATLGAVKLADRVETLRSGLRGWVLLPGDPGYDEARAVWNAMIDRRPAVIVRCLGAADVIDAVEFTRKCDPSKLFRFNQNIRPAT